jgi:hypothetical protein
MGFYNDIIREDRRQDTGAPPSAGGLLALCAKHREQFRRWRADINDLLGNTAER